MKFDLEDAIKRIQTRSNFVWVRHSDFKVIRTTEIYLMCYGRRKVKEIDWSDERGMYYTKHSKWMNFKKGHTFVGEIYDRRNPI